MPQKQREPWHLARTFLRVLHWPQSDSTDEGGDVPHDKHGQSAGQVADFSRVWIFLSGANRNGFINHELRCCSAESNAAR